MLHTGGHVDIWSVTLVTLRNGALVRQNFDVFYDKDRVFGETNKNANTGMMALRLFVDPDRNPTNTGRSVLGDLAPQVTHLIFSGDTGNGFRGIPMSWYHSTLHRQYGLSCEQIPLCPRHAHNPTDAHFSHLNCFFRKLMRVTILTGPEQFAKALALATDPTSTHQRRLIKRTTVCYHRFLVTEYITIPPWLQTTHPSADLSLMKLGYFLLSTTREDGRGDEFNEGIMRVCKYARAPSPDDPQNPLIVWDMRTPAHARDAICQQCCDREVFFPFHSFQCACPELTAYLSCAGTARPPVAAWLYEGGMPIHARQWWR
jgi:hypothetical protein